MPTKVFAIELMSSPDTPKSHILISPFVFASTFDGLISGRVSSALQSIEPGYAPL